MRRIRHLLPLLLVAIFWIAQVQGTVHGIGHLSSTAAATDHVTSPHALHCDECASLAQAGAVPLFTPGMAALLATSCVALRARQDAGTIAGPINAYRSRAPPLALI